MSEDNEQLHDRDFRAIDRANDALQRNIDDLEDRMNNFDHYRNGGRRQGRPQPPVFAGRPGDHFKKWLVKFNHFAEKSGRPRES